jgi:hypothetical protein
VLSVCRGLYYLCPSLHPRSKQPVKRYKKILTNIFPATQVGKPFFLSSPMVWLLAKHNRVIDLIRSRGIELRPLSLCIVHACYC